MSTREPNAPPPWYPIGWSAPTMPTPEHPHVVIQHLVVRAGSRTGTACGVLAEYALVVPTAEDPCSRCLTSKMGQQYQRRTQ